MPLPRILTRITAYLRDFFERLSLVLQIVGLVVFIFPIFVILRPFVTPPPAEPSGYDELYRDRYRAGAKGGKED